MVSAHRAFISSVSGIFMNIHEPALCTQVKGAVHRRRLFISLNCETVSETKANRLKSPCHVRCVCVCLAGAAASLISDGLSAGAADSGGGSGAQRTLGRCSCRRRPL